MSSSLLLTWLSVLQQKRCKKVWIKYLTCDSYDMTISIKKTKVVYQPAHGKPYKEPSITLKGQRLQVVDKFTNLRSTLSRIMHIDDEFDARIAKASEALRKSSVENYKLENASMLVRRNDTRITSKPGLLSAPHLPPPP